MMLSAPAAAQIIAADILLPQTATSLSAAICFDLNHLSAHIVTHIHTLPCNGLGHFFTLINLRFSFPLFDLRAFCSHFELAPRFGRMPKTAEVQFAQDCSYTVLKDSICPRYSWTKDQKHEPHISKLVVVFRFPSSSLPTLLIYLTYKQFSVYNLCDSATVRF